MARLYQINHIPRHAFLTVWCQASIDMTGTRTEKYMTGKLKPRYPVPAVHPIPAKMLASIEMNDGEIETYDLLMASIYNTL